MVEDQVEGTAKEYMGKAQDAAGDMLGDSNTQIKGKMNEAAGKLQSAYGDVADQAGDIAAELGDRIKSQPLVAVLIAGGLGYLLGRIARS